MSEQRKGHTKAQGEADVKRFRMNKYAPEMLKILDIVARWECPDSSRVYCGKCDACQARALVARIDGDG